MGSTAARGLTTLELANHAWFIGHAIVGVVLAPCVLRTLDLNAFQSASSLQPAEWVPSSGPP